MGTKGPDTLSSAIGFPPEPLPIRVKLNRPDFVCAQGVNADFFKALQRFLMGMSEAITFSGGDDYILWMYCI